MSSFDQPSELAGREMYELATELFPICRSLTGDGVRQTLKILQRELPELRTYEVPSGTQCFDWTVPPEWNIDDAYVIDPDGKKIIDFKASNLHVVGYSTPIDTYLSLDELQEHLYSLPEHSGAIPYVTSYYKERWGFCLTHTQRLALQPGQYRAVIKSRLAPGALTYGELILEGEEKREIFLSTYICHPSLANNEISGPVVQVQLAKWLQSLPNRRYTYRIIFIPETIGSIVYLSRNASHLKAAMIAGFNLSCLGDDRSFSFLPSRKGTTLSDRMALHVLKAMAPDFIKYSFLTRGSDERQYCSPGIDLPVASIMRSMYGTYPEYHTSLDDLSLISPSGLFGGYSALHRSLFCLENIRTYQTTVLCEPQLGKRGLYPTLGTTAKALAVQAMMDLIAYSTGNEDLLTIAETINQPMWELLPIVRVLVEQGLLREIVKDEYKNV